MAQSTEILEALKSGDWEAAHAITLAVLSGPQAGIETIDLAFEVGDWLFDCGDAVVAAEVYAAAFKSIERSGTAPRFELARRLDRLAEFLIGAGHLQGAAEALKGSIALSRSDEGLDNLALQQRLCKLQALEEKLGRAGEGGAYDKEREAHDRGHLPYALPGRVKAALPKRSDVFEGRQRSASAPPAPAAPPRQADGGDQYRKISDALSVVPDSRDYIRVAVHFATHRKSEDAPDTTPYTAFGFEPTEHLNFGRAVITVPARRIVGHYEEPSAGWFGNGGELDKSFTVQVIDLLPGQEQLMSEVGEIVGQSRKKELLVFVHGYRTTLASGLMRAAQLKVDMKIEGAVVLYSLPSKGTLLGYGHDRTNADNPRAHEQLRDFLNAITSETGATRIHLVAHSLGCEMSIRALNEMWKRDGVTPKRRFDEIVFAAPDVDHMSFCDVVPRVCDLSRRVTVYASAKDIPLALIGTIIQRDRAGFDAPRLAGIKGVDAVDTSDGTSWFGSYMDQWGHWDFADESIDDIRAVVWLSLIPGGRRSRLAPRKRADGATYWAVEPCDAQTLGIFRKALEWSREFGIEEALATAKKGESAEQAMRPPGTRLAEFQRLGNELTLFSASILPVA